jgi:hypothetical protein
LLIQGGFRPSLASSNISTKGVSPYTCRKLSGSKPIFFSLLLDHVLPNESLPSSWCYPQEGALRVRSISSQLQTPNQCGPEGPPPLPRDFSYMTKSDPSLRDEGDPPSLNSELPLPDNNTADDPRIPLILPLDIILYPSSFIRLPMVGEMDLFHDRPISLVLVLLVPRSSPPVHLHFTTRFWAWGQWLFMTLLRFHFLLYPTLLSASCLLSETFWYSCFVTTSLYSAIPLTYFCGH